MVWFILVLMSLGLIVACGFIPEKAAGKVVDTSHEVVREDEER